MMLQRHLRNASYPTTITFGWQRYIANCST